jgi:hypothetical protein
MRCTVERASPVALASLPRLSPSGWAPTSRKIAAAREITCIPSINFSMPSELYRIVIHFTVPPIDTEDYDTKIYRSLSPCYIIMLGLLSALPPLAIDMGLPAIPALESAFHIGIGAATRTLTVFLLGFSIGPILFGPLSDRYGRKPVLLLGLGLFSLASLACALAGNIDSLLLLRLLQGVAAGARRRCQPPSCAMCSPAMPRCRASRMWRWSMPWRRCWRRCWAPACWRSAAGA